MNKAFFLLLNQFGFSIPSSFPQQVQINHEHLCERVYKSLDLLIEILVVLPQLFNFINGMEYRGVMFVAEFPADLRQ